MADLQFARWVRAVGLMMAVLMVGLLTWLETTALAQFPTTPQLTETATLCPAATWEPFWVEPVTSPTSLFTQTITVIIGYGDAITVTAESGTFVVTGTNLSGVTMTLLANTTHHLNVAAHVRPVFNNGCPYGNYTLHTNTDKFGAPLTIVQEFSGTLTPRAYLPVILGSANPVTGSVLLHDGACCIAGIAGTTLDIDAVFSATSLLAPIADMRVAPIGGIPGGCATEAQLAPYPWEPFTTTMTFTCFVYINWFPFQVSAQYRDAVGNVSPVACDDIEVEGMPPTPSPP